MDQTANANQRARIKQDYNLRVVSEHIALEAIDIDKALDLYTDDIVWESPARGLRFEGKQAVAENYRAMFGSLENVELQHRERFATEDRVVDDAVVRFRLIGEGFANAPLPVGSLVELRLLHLFHIREGKIAREIVFEAWQPQAL